ncbi:TonB-dependent receptor [Nibrella saemangeumensis]|uniref:TonB-dependent receptor n=1 Tax=Nibrella saemangeumensis TaxID=1084526 RepID=A0ABP8NSA1_9BACT
MKNWSFVFSLLLAIPTLAQVKIAGSVTDTKGEALPGVSVFLKDTYSGASTNEKGEYRFTATEKGSQMLVVSMVGYKEVQQPVQLDQETVIVSVTLEEAINRLEGVTITAGSFEASDGKKSVMLKPLDIVTTASAVGDLAGAINTLPGTQKNGESGRLFVRGGASNEARLFIDGLYVQNPFQLSAPNLPTRTRFSPFIFKGTNFSTGGYSAEYGQALSSTLVLNTIDYPARTQTDLSLLSVGGSLSHTQHSERTSVTADASYFNLAPYYGLISQNVRWTKPPVSADGSLHLRQKVGKQGLLKVYSLISTAQSALYQPDPANIDRERSVALNNRYVHLNSSYRDALSANWWLKAGLAYSFLNDQTQLAPAQIGRKERSLHGKLTLVNQVSQNISLNMGAELIASGYRQHYRDSAAASPKTALFSENLAGAFIEADVYVTPKLVARIGSRTEYSTLLQRGNWSPRINLAYKTGLYSQVSLAYGSFYQSPENDLLIRSSRLDFERANHFILNFQRVRQKQVLRVETYYKQYEHLVKFDKAGSRRYDNNGYGYAQGVDLFWRDTKTWRGTDYWVSYSFIDTKRNYRDLSALQTPSFASAHNLSIVFKRFIAPLKSQVGFTNSVTSGRPYSDPNVSEGEMRKTPVYHDLSVNWSYLHRSNIILYASVSNVTGRKNTFGYLYNPTPDETGIYRRREIGQGATRFVFVGLLVTFSTDKTANQLNNL